MLITLANADFSAAGLGKVARYINGMPQQDLAGLWLFADGSNGDTVTSIADSSGNGRIATLMSSWSGGKKRSYGMEVDSNQGVAYRTDVPINPAGRQLTVFMAGASTLPGSETGVFNNWMGSTANAGMGSPADTHSNQPALTVNSKGVDNAPRWQLFDNGGDMIGSLTVSATVQTNYGQPSVSALDIDGTGGTARLHVLGAPTVGATAAEIGTFYDGVTDRGKLAFGPWPHANARSTATSIARVYAVAAYLRSFSEAEAQTHMQAMRAIAESRGVTGF